MSLRSDEIISVLRGEIERAGVAQYIQFNGGDALERPAPKLPEGMPGAGGYREHDILVITEDGAEVLTLPSR